LPDDLEQLVHDTIGCCIAVPRVLGPGLLEEIYSRALGLELAACGIAYMRVAHKRVGLLVNFNVVVLKDGLRRKVL
jgi:hypothetical protein